MACLGFWIEVGFILLLGWSSTRVLPMEVQLSMANLSLLIIGLLFLAAFHKPVRYVPLPLQGFVNRGLETAMLMDIWMNLQPAKNSQHSWAACSTPVDQLKLFRPYSYMNTDISLLPLLEIALASFDRLLVRFGLFESVA